MDQSDGMVELDGKDWTIVSKTGPESWKGRKTKDSNQMMEKKKREARFMPSYSLKLPLPTRLPLPLPALSSFTHSKAPTYLWFFHSLPIRG